MFLLMMKEHLVENTRKCTSPYLSKSLYIKGLQCHKALWLHKNRPELKGKISAAQQVVFDSGTDLGILAQGLFPGGVEVPYSGLTHSEQLIKTQELIAGGTTTIYEATFSFDNVFVKVDILHQSERGWHIYEVKNSTGCKDVYINDIAIQQYVVTGSGLRIMRACLIHVNKTDVHHDDNKVEKRFSILDVTEKVMVRETDVPIQLIAMREALDEDIPAIDIGPHCEKPYTCDFKGHCWSHIPADSVFPLSEISTF